eukprot:scaffold44284_cov21-Tisochrysis_lutea.AAC.4
MERPNFQVDSRKFISRNWCSEHEVTQIGASFKTGASMYNRMSKPADVLQNLQHVLAAANILILRIVIHEH